MTSSAHKDPYGNIVWYNCKNQFHRENGPALEYEDGSMEWWLNGLRHRENGPAIERKNHVKKWFQYGKLHRENGPAVEYVNGDKEWWVNDQLHREDGPAIERANGTKEWCLNGQSFPEIERQVKENMTRIQAEKDQQELLSVLSQDQDISVKINTSSVKVSKKL